MYQLREAAALRKKPLLLAPFVLGLGLIVCVAVFGPRYYRTGSLRLMARG
jgi:hypothetical protein